MKKIFSILTVVATLFAISCSSEYDDTAVWDEFKKHDERISKLETLCGQMNTNISSLQAIVTALQSNDYVTGIAPITQNGVEVGYTITFSKSGSITIYHGKDGANGQDGKEDSLPVIGVKQDTDGVYYWTLNGEWLFNDNGEKIKAISTDGANGKDGITPQLKIEDDYWYISYDNGASWTQIGKVTSLESSSCMIKDVIETDTAVIFTLADGSTITISKIGNSAPNDDIMQFVDQNAKLLCVFYFDTDGDGELSYAEAAAVTELKPGAFSYSPIIFFDEFQYFTGLEKIEDEAFYNCLSLKHITLPQGVKVIGNSAFGNCEGLPNITIIDSVTEIGGYAFCNCPSLTNLTIGNGVTLIGEYAFCDCYGLTNVTIPSSVTSIGNCAFQACNSLVSVTIGNGVTSIGDYAFAFCDRITNVAIPDSVTVMGDGAFDSCDSLANVIIGNGVTSISHSAFGGCVSLTSVTIPNSVTKIGEVAFCRCSSLTSITIPNSVKTIGNQAFASCKSLTNITIPGSVTEFGKEIFRECTNLTSVIIENGVTSIGHSAFYNCDELTSVTIPDSVTSIGVTAFSYCDGLTSVTIPDSVTEIGGSAFAYCKSLACVTIGNGVTSIGNGAFGSCLSLTSFYCKPITPPTVSLIGEFADNFKIYVPRASVEVYKTTYGWSRYAGMIEPYGF